MRYFSLIAAGTVKIRQSTFQNIILTDKIMIMLFTAVFLTCCKPYHNKSSETELSLFIKPSCVIDTKYPTWFFNPPQGSVTGYYHDTVTSLSDAKIRAAGYHSMRFYGKLRYYEDERTNDFQDSISFYFKEADTTIAESLIVADSFFMCCTEKIYLLAESTSTIDTSRVDACFYSLGNNENNSGKIIATGEYRFEYYNQSLCWMHAEENAIKELCNQALHNFASLRKKNDYEMSTTMMKQYDLSINHVCIDRRSFDTENNMCEVTISCNAADIVPISSNETSP